MKADEKVSPAGHLSVCEGGLKAATFLSCSCDSKAKKGWRNPAAPPWDGGHRGAIYYSLEFLRRGIKLT